MSSNTPHHQYKELPGSERKPVAGARHLGPVDANEVVEVSLYLRDPASGALKSNVHQQIQSHTPPISREEYASLHSASSADIASIEQFAREHGLTVVETHPVARRIVLSGTAQAISAAFGTQLQRYEVSGKTFRGRTGTLQLPEELDGIVVSVLGLDDRPQASTHLRYYNPERVSNAQATNVSYTPTQLAQLYNFPRDLNGQGQCIAIIELGGGYQKSDLTTYFRQLNMAIPHVVSVSVDGAKNRPGADPNGADGEVELDIEVAGAIAPAARIAVYFAPNTDRGFVDAITQAIHDTTNRPSVISISWGSAESNWSAQAIQTMDQAFQSAVTLGVTVCVAAGDNGSSDGVSDGQAHVDFPASDPYVLGCGGTSLRATNNQIASEVVWNDATDSATGGGVSDNFALPSWQSGVNVPPSANPNKHVGRGVPDVAGDADPQTGYQIMVDGQSTVIGGTSAVAPLWAGLVALLNQHLKRPVGFLNATLYQNYQVLCQQNALSDITSGNNGAYSAKTGWDACSGLGTPRGTQLATVLASLLPQSSIQQEGLPL